MKEFPKTLNDAVAIALRNLTDEARKELAEVAFIDPHTKYKTDFEKIVAGALGLNDGSNPELLMDVVSNHAEELHFLETDGHTVEPRAVLRVVLAEMVKAVKCG